MNNRQVVGLSVVIFLSVSLTGWILTIDMRANAAAERKAREARERQEIADEVERWGKVAATERTAKEKEKSEFQAEVRKFAKKPPVMKDDPELTEEQMAEQKRKFDAEMEAWRKENP